MGSAMERTEKSRRGSVAWLPTWLPPLAVLTDESEDAWYSEAIERVLAKARAEGMTPLLGPGAKCEVTLRYADSEPVGAARIVVSIDHSDRIDSEEVREVVRRFVRFVLPEDWMCDEQNFIVNDRLGESIARGYTDDIMGDAREYFALAAKALEKGLSVAELDEAIEDKLAAKMGATARETTGRATGEPRPLWPDDALPEERDNPAAFAWRAYAVEAAAGTLHLGVIRQEDEPLAVKLVSWLRSPANRKQVPEGFDIPTKPEWNTRRLAKLRDDPGSREVIQLLRVERDRAERTRRTQRHPEPV
jgi:hypothetical protein